MVLTVLHGLDCLALTVLYGIDCLICAIFARHDDAVKNALTGAFTSAVNKVLLLPLFYESQA